MLARRDHSAGELRKKSLEFSTDLVEKTLKEFSDKGWQSDARFTSAFIRYRFEQGKGIKLIRYELKNRGISEDCIDEALEQFPRESWKSQCERVYLKKFPTPPKNYQEKQKRRLFLANRGIDLDLIREVVK